MHTFVDPLCRAHKLFANRISMVSGDVRLTYAETWSRCRPWRFRPPCRTP